MDGLTPGLKSIRPGSIPEAPIGLMKNANENEERVGRAKNQTLSLLSQGVQVCPTVAAGHECHNDALWMSAY